MPLVGAALWPTQRIKALASQSQRFAFPRYNSDKECRATAASNHLNKWMRGSSLNHTNHDLRHTMADRLREVQCPRAIQFAIKGHASKDAGDDYGRGYSLKVKAEWLEKVVYPGALGKS